MRKKISMMLAMAVCLLVACGGGETGNAKIADNSASDRQAEEKTGKVYEIKLTSNDSTNTIWMKKMQEACDKISVRTDGGVSIQIHGNGEMLVADEGLEAVMSDSAVFYFADPNNYGDYVPELNTICAPYLWDDHKTVEEFTKTDMMSEIFQKAEAANIHTVGDGFFVVGVRSIMAEKPVQKLADLKGLTLRVVNSTLYIDTFKALGCNYQAMPMSETFNALETGMIDGCENTSGNFVNNGINEAMKTPYYSLDKHMVCIVSLSCGQGFWESLPEEYQAIITEEFAAAISASNQEVADSEESNLEILKERGVTIVEIDDLSEFKNAVQASNEKLKGFEEIAAAVESLKK